VRVARSAARVTCPSIPRTGHRGVSPNGRRRGRWSRGSMGRTPRGPFRPRLVPSPAMSSSPAAESSAKPSASPRAFVAAIDAFVERVTSGKLTYHVAFDGSVRASINLLPIIGALDVSGENFQSSFTYDFSHDYSGMGKVRVQVRGVNGHGYVKSGAAAWRTIKNFGDSQSYVLFKNVK